MDNLTSGVKILNEKGGFSSFSSDQIVLMDSVFLGAKEYHFTFYLTNGMVRKGYWIKGNVQAGLMIMKSTSNNVKIEKDPSTIAEDNQFKEYYDSNVFICSDLPVLASVFWKDYLSWVKENDYPQQITKKKFYAYFHRLGVTSKNTRDGKTFFGINIKQ